MRDTAGSGVDSDRAVVTEERMAARWGILAMVVAMVKEVVVVKRGMASGGLRRRNINFKVSRKPRIHLPCPSTIGVYGNCQTTHF